MERRCCVRNLKRFSRSHKNNPIAIWMHQSHSTNQKKKISSTGRHRWRRRRAIDQAKSTEKWTRRKDHRSPRFWMGQEKWHSRWIVFSSCDTSANVRMKQLRSNIHIIYNYTYIRRSQISILCFFLFQHSHKVRTKNGEMSSTRCPNYYFYYYYFI